MKLKDFIAKAIEELEEFNDEITVVVCLDTEMNVVNDGYNQVKFTIKKTKKK